MTTVGLVRRLTLGAMMGLLVALAVLGTGSHSASAQPIKGVKEQGEFVDTCKELGGTSTSVGPRTVKCKYQNGAALTCNFSNGSNPDGCVTYVPPTGRTTSGGHSTGTGQPGGATGGSATTGGGTVVVDAPTPTSDVGNDDTMTPLD